MTAGRWPWRLEFATECVTTHLPNELAPKMDGARPYILYSVEDIMIISYLSVGGREDILNRSQWVTIDESIFSADLGGSSKDSGEMPEHRRGERFHSNGNRL